MKRAAADFRRILSREFRELDVDWQRRFDELDAQRVQQAEQVSQDRRDLIAQLAQERAAARAQAHDFEEQFIQEQAVTTRLRSSRNQGALDRMAALEKETREAKQRRGAGQMTVKQANLWKTHAKVAQAELTVEKKRLRDFWTDGIDYAARAKQLEKDNTALLGQAEAAQQAAQQELQAVQAAAQAAAKKAQQMALAAGQEAEQKVQAARQEAAKFKAVAEPAKSHFFQMSGHWSAAVDLAICECLELGVACSKVLAPHHALPQPNPTQLKR